MENYHSLATIISGLIRDRLCTQTYNFLSLSLFRGSIMVNLIASTLAGNQQSAKVLEAFVAFANTNKSSFVSFVYENDYAVTRYTVHLGVCLRGAYERALKELEANRNLYVNDAVQLQAIDELIASVKNSLDKGIGNNDAYTKKDKYERLAPNLKYDKDSGKIYLSGFVIGKTVLEHKKDRKPVNSAPKTIAKNVIRKRHTKLDKFRDFILDEKHFGSISVNKNRIVVNSQVVAI